MDVSIISAVVAGFLSFFSPCILPLVPVYILYIFSQRGSKLKNAFLFVLGFSIVFVGLGILASLFGVAFSQYKWVIVKIAAIILILMGLVMLDLSPDFLKRLFIPIGGNGNYQKERIPLILGMLLSISWTPCVGPILASILSLAAVQKTFVKGVLLLVFYSIGFAMPFLLASLFIERIKSFFSFINRHVKVVEYLAGIFMVIFGVLVFFDKINFLR
ncbi:cytochrome c biogenesis protein, transmembrane region [Caldicellulosiruptor saccharolyticus DSM 8903]|uniref:Cytochrome c biogenesis protein, transmembrane region n=1 Tax=Caldicellulosiruptor saccharolyticus (strain ATCC 43494 / DSM 8903 / Tp8T 6331) TaxID=351627 RepID=A4XIC4_CALS8|nr:cytochrome c biogenesis protein CcdA [Caldicellulosiruptor saccharolyticus]ABP66659.1 cytochrome c biogenesis protein, transmembrane region [Caldicellulosiruptor saccharolyticus DSM 8903]